MTNTETDKLNTKPKKSGTTPESGHKFELRTDERGLWFLFKTGVGTKPAISDERFTSKASAEKALDRYIDGKSEG
jgi:hypothetical protein